MRPGKFTEAQILNAVQQVKDGPSGGCVPGNRGKIGY